MVVQLLTFVSLAVFVVFCLLRVVRFATMPIHLRWELYPVPHEGRDSGGSYFEELDWWTHKREKHQLKAMWFMGKEILFLKALFEENRSLWNASFPFHVGLYLYGGWVVFVVLGAILELVGVSVGAVQSLTVVLGLGAFGIGALGTLGLLIMRMTDEKLAPFTSFKEHFNLLLILALFATGLLAWATAGSFDPFRDYLVASLSLQAATGIGAMTVAHLLVLAFFMTYFPFTHMTHAFTKWFMWHEVRWSDDANLKGSKVEAKVRGVLAYPVSWSAPHIDGKGRSWAEVATSVPGTDEK
jgi:nitrate reductase gamma subunit